MPDNTNEKRQQRKPDDDREPRPVRRPGQADDELKPGKRDGEMPEIDPDDEITARYSRAGE